MGATWMLDPKKVLVFNGNRTLIAIIRSVRAASLLTNSSLQSITNACSGIYISSNGYYYRNFDPNVIVEMEDIDTLKLEEYDQLCGVSRKYHSISQMSRNRRRSNGEKLEPKKKNTTKRKTNKAKCK